MWITGESNRSQDSAEKFSTIIEEIKYLAKLKSDFIVGL